MFSLRHKPIRSRLSDEVYVGMLEEDQVQQEEEKLAATMEVCQMPAPSKEMLEVVDALAAYLDEFKDRGHK